VSRNALKPLISGSDKRMSIDAERYRRFERDELALNSRGTMQARA
jgi:hypothetical protein